MKNLLIAIFLVLSTPILAKEAPWIAEDGSCEAVGIRDMGYNVKIILCMTLSDRLYIGYIVKQNKDHTPKSWIEADWNTTNHFFPWVLERDYQNSLVELEEIQATRWGYSHL